MVIKLLLLLWLKLFVSCQEIDINSSYINQKNFTLKNAVYIIRNREGNINLELNPEIKFTYSPNPVKQNFEIIENKNENNSDIFYFIKDNDRNLFLSAQENSDNLILNNNGESNQNDSNIDINYSLWNITPKINKDNKLIYYVQNKKTGYYWETKFCGKSYKINLRNISNESNLTKENEFLFIELYEKVKIKNSTLLDNEPIDVLIKYIDLNDEKLNRPGIPVINKDYENGEIKYCVRSILQNIPWIRKIFILMPNDEVKYFLPKENISEKIIYVKDKDLLGFDSENSAVFQFHSYKMKRFGLSENFILMDDDYFIAKPINKNEMFYEENGHIYPAIITYKYFELNKNIISQEAEILKSKARNIDPHSEKGFQLLQDNTKLLLYDIFGNDEIRFGKKLIEPGFTHNALPVKMSDIKEIYNYLYNNINYRNTFLKEKIRSTNDLQFHILYWCYVKNKYGRKSYIIPSRFYDLAQTFKVLMDKKKKLFVINTSVFNYNYIHYLDEKRLLESLFPNKTKYESDYELINKQTKINKIINTIKNSLTEKIKEQISKISSKHEISLDKEMLTKNLRKHLNDDINYKNVIRKEVEDLKFKCILQEILNCILFASFLLLIIYSYMNLKKNKI